MDHKSPRSRFTVERVLLAAVLILQVGILLLLTSRSPSPAQPEPGGLDAMSGPHASRRTFSDPDEPHPGLAQLPIPGLVRYKRDASTPTRRMMADMDRMFERAVGDLEEIKHMASLDDGWDRLLAMPAFDVCDRGTAYHVRFTLPNGDPAGTDLTLEGRVLTIGVSSPSRVDPLRGPMALRYSRQIMLPGPVAEAADARAFVTNGLLYVVVPKAAAPAVNSRVVEPVRFFAQ